MKPYLTKKMVIINRQNNYEMFIFFIYFQYTFIIRAQII